MISIVACCHSVKLCAHAARAFPIATLPYGRRKNFFQQGGWCNFTNSETESKTFFY